MYEDDDEDSLNSLTLVCCVVALLRKIGGQLSCKTFDINSSCFHGITHKKHSQHPSFLYFTKSVEK